MKKLLFLFLIIFAGCSTKQIAQIENSAKADSQIIWTQTDSEMVAKQIAQELKVKNICKMGQVSFDDIINDTDLKLDFSQINISLSEILACDGNEKLKGTISLDFRKDKKLALIIFNVTIYDSQSAVHAYFTKKVLKYYR